MQGESRRDLLVKALDGLLEQLQLASDELHAQREGIDQSQLIADRHGPLHQGQALFEQFGVAGAVEIIEGFEGGGFGLLHRLQAGPFE